MKRAARLLTFVSAFLSLLSGCGGSSVLKLTTPTKSILLYPDNISKQAIVVSAALPADPYRAISISLQGLPDGVTASSASLSMISNGQAAFVLTAATTAGSAAFAQGATQLSFPITIQATAGTLQSTASVQLTLASPNPNFVPAKMDLPVLEITTDNAAPIVSLINYVSGSVSITPAPSGTDVAYSGTMQIRGHGNTTWLLPKKPYKLKLDSKASLLGMPAGKTWVLLANYDDKSLLRDQVAFEVGRRLGMAWTPNSRFVELFLNGQYEGNYQLTEEIKIDKNRVNIPEMDDTDNSGKSLTGGYCLKSTPGVTRTISSSRRRGE